MACISAVGPSAAPVTTHVLARPTVRDGRLDRLIDAHKQYTILCRRRGWGAKSDPVNERTQRKCKEKPYKCQRALDPGTVVPHHIPLFVTVMTRCCNVMYPKYSSWTSTASIEYYCRYVLYIHCRAPINKKPTCFGLGKGAFHTNLSVHNDSRTHANVKCYPAFLRLFHVATLYVSTSP